MSSSKCSSSSSSSSLSTYSPCSTPRCVINIDVAQRNASKMLQVVETDLGLSFRPHVKTHKTIEGALLQTGGRRSKIVVSTLAELQFYSEIGEFTDILYAVPLAGDHKISYLWNNFISQNQKGDIKVVIDHPEQFQRIEQWMKDNVVDVSHDDDDANHNNNSNNKWKILLMLGVGNELSKNNVLMHQVGLDPTKKESFELAETLHNSQHIAFEGLYIHASHGYNATSRESCTQVAKEECDTIGTFAKTLRDEYQIRCPNVGVGSTPTCANPAIYKTVLDPITNELTKVIIDTDLIQRVYTDNLITELHAGNYLVYDSMQSNTINSCHIKDVAMTVKTQVISSYPESNTLMVDLGWTGISKQEEDENNGYGIVVSHPELKLHSMKQESGEMKPLKDNIVLDMKKYPIGNTELSIIPYHACAAAHQYRSIFIENTQGECIGEWIRCPSR